MSATSVKPSRAAAQAKRPPEDTNVRILAATTLARARPVPSSAALVRRRRLVQATKYALPLLALTLLSSIALWPELDRAQDQARIAFRRMARSVDGATIIDARYRGVDDRGRPYTVTANTAVQVNPERIDLTTPQGDMTLESGAWIMVRARDGIYMQHTSQLDLSHDVTLYRDDGTILHTETAATDLKAGASAGADPVHAEGPFGRLDAEGFALVDKGASIQFGPGNALLNAATSHPSANEPPPHLMDAGDALATLPAEPPATPPLQVQP